MTGFILASALWSATPGSTLNGSSWVGQPCPPLIGRDFRQHAFQGPSPRGASIVMLVSREQFDRAETLCRTLAGRPDAPKIYLICDTAGIPFFISWLVKGKIRERYETTLQGTGLTLAKDVKEGAPIPESFPAIYVDDERGAMTKAFGALAEKLGDRLPLLVINAQGNISSVFEEAPSLDTLAKTLTPTRPPPAD